MSGRPLVAPGTRGRFRDLMTVVPVGAITAAFHDEGFAADPECTYEDSSERRSLTQRYLEAVDWSDPEHVRRALRAIERLLERVDNEHWDSMRRALRGDGYNLSAAGQITPAGPQLVDGALPGLREPAAIRENLDRIQRAIADDPAQAVGSAKELIESTAKTVLLERGQPADENADLPALIRQAQQALGLHPSSTTPGPDGSEAVKKILGSVSSVALGVGELRNRGFGTGHGAAGARVGLRERHARLAVNAAVTWCQLVLDTLADTGAPWRGTPATATP